MTFAIKAGNGFKSNILLFLPEKQVTITFFNYNNYAAQQKRTECDLFRFSTTMINITVRAFIRISEKAHIAMSYNGLVCTSYFNCTSEKRNSLCCLDFWNPFAQKKNHFCACILLLCPNYSSIHLCVKKVCEIFLRGI